MKINFYCRPISSIGFPTILTLFYLFTNVQILNAQENLNFFEVKQQWEQKIQKFTKDPNLTEEENLKYESRERKMLGRWNHLWRFRLGPNGEMTTASKEYSKLMEINLRNEDIENRSSCNSIYDDNIYWTNLGPLNSNGALGSNNGSNTCSGYLPNKQNQGRLDAISVHPSNTQHILVGGHNGGIWRSTNGGATWTNTTDDEGYSLFGINSIKRHPANPDIVYAATTVGGGLWEATRTIVYGMGLIVSTDGGTSWQATGLNYSNYGTWNSQLIEIAIDPNSTINNTIIYCISNTDVWRWQGIHLANGAWNSIYQDGSPWANGPLWHGRINNNDIIINSQGTVFFSNYSGLFKYENGAYSQVTSFAIPSAINTSTSCGNPPQTLRYHMNIEVNSQDHIVMLIAFNSCNSNGKYIYKSIDNGISWSTPKLVDVYTNYSSRFPLLAVSPNNSDVIYCEKDDWYRCVIKSTDFGTSFAFTNNAQNHVDIRNFQSISGSGPDDHLYVATDGGISKTTNGQDWVDITGQGMSITNYYGCGIIESNDKMIFAGAQDGSINYYNNGNWYETLPGGDNGDCLINPYNSNMIFQESQHALQRGTLSGNNVFGNIYYYPVAENTFMNPLKWNGISTTEFFIGDRYLKLGTTASTWLTTITTSLHSNDKNISSVEVSRNNANVAYYSTGSFVWRNSAPTDDGIYKAVRTGSTWNVTNISSNLYGQVHGKIGLSEPITDIAVDPNNENRIWVTMGGFDSNKKVYYSGNGGVSWTNITSVGLPNLPCTAIVYQEMSNDRIYVGMDNGVYYTDNSLSCWVKYGNNGPQCMINDMEINQCSGKLVVATHGRGLWQAPLIIDPVSTPIIGNVTWSTPKTIASNIEVQSGATLNINNTTINIAKDIKITVKPGGRININNSTLTNTCGYNWWGVEIFGNSALAQTYADQGAVIINNSTIEHANEAFTMINGGILQADQTNFFNNKRSVAYIYYIANNNIGFFKRCNFKTDANYRFSSSLLAHFTMWSVKNIKIEGCNFETTNNFDWDIKRVTGISTIDANFIVDQYCVAGGGGCSNLIRSTFKGLNKAIKAERTTGSFTFSVYNSDFQDNAYGIITSGHNSFNIRANTFKVGKNSVGNSIVHEGVSIFSGTLFNVDQNTFEPTFDNSSQPTTIGIRATDTGSDNNEIYKNTFKKLTTSNTNVFYGNLANGINRNTTPGSLNGLKYYCNTNQNNIANGYDFAVTDAGISHAQGSLTFPCRNTFSLGTITSNSDFNNGAYTGFINYYHRPVTNESPVNKFQVNNFLSSSSNNSCSNKYTYLVTAPTDITYSEMEEAFSSLTNLSMIMNQAINVATDTNQIMIIESELNDINRDMARLINDACQYLLEMDGNKEELINWYERLNSCEGKMAIIDLLITDNNLAELTHHFNELIILAQDTNQELGLIQSFIDLKNLQINAINEGRHPLSELNVSELNLIDSYTNLTGVVGDQARAIMNYHGAAYFIPPVFPENSSARLDISVESRDDLDKTNVIAKPNPASNLVNFEIYYPKQNNDKQSDDNYSLIVTNSLGLKVFVSDITSDQKVVSWNCSQMPTGIYQYVILDKNGAHLISRKLILIN